MDLSKLPRLSETDKHSPPPPPPQTSDQPAPVLQYQSVAPSSDIGGQVWLSAILGIVFMFMGWNFARFLGAKLTGQPFHTGVAWQVGDKAGQEVDYFDLEGYTAYTDTAVFLFGLSMVLEAISLVKAQRNTPGSRAFVAFSLAVTVATTLFNVVVALMFMSKGTPPIISLLVIAFGGYMAMSEWQVLKRMQMAAPVQPRT